MLSSGRPAEKTTGIVIKRNRERWGWITEKSGRPTNSRYDSVAVTESPNPNPASNSFALIFIL